MFISEIGWHQKDNEVTLSNPDWFNRIYQDLVVHMDEGTIGGAFFEYSDEPYSKVDVLQQTMGVVAFNVSTDNNGKTSMDTDMFTRDTLYRKQFIFDALKNGTVNGVAYNFNSDVWKLMGRTKIVLAQSECKVVPPNHTSTSSTSSTTNTQSTSGSSNNGSTSQSGTSGQTTIQQDSSSTTPQPIVETSGSEKMFYSVVMTAILLFIMLN